MAENSKATTKQLATQLAQEGYCVVPQALDDDMLQALRQRLGDVELAQAPKGNFANSGALILPDYHDPVIVRLLAWPKALKTLAAMGFNDPRLHSFYVTTKPPKAGALAWHSDLFYRYEQPEPTELFLIYYLQDTAPENGCLRVVPGSHLWSHSKRHEQPEDTTTRSDEVDVPVKAGDLFIGDRRILHATHINKTNSWRTGVTIAYAPDFARLAEPIQAFIVQNRCLPPKGWWDDKRLTASINERLQQVLPVYKGDAEPISAE